MKSFLANFSNLGKFTGSPFTSRVSLQISLKDDESAHDDKMACVYSLNKAAFATWVNGHEAILQST